MVERIAKAREVEKNKKTPAALAKYLGIESAEVYDQVFL
jgi:hypothetical protein